MRNPTQVVDLGCGPGNIFHALEPDINFVGVDISSKYLSRAKKMRPNAFLICEDVTTEKWMSQFSHKDDTLYLGLALFHHISDDGLKNMFRRIEKYMGPSSSFFTVDPTIQESTNSAARWFANNDRCKFVRTPQLLVWIL